jgi:exopolyphosphatase/guanosine-5'-triphosphate,3'-diphosphate pyrophosphatase
LSDEERELDPLLAASIEFCMLRSRSPQHAYELIEWSDKCFASLAIDETLEEKRLRHAACLLADVGWRAHPDYRGDQSLSLIANANFVGVSHAERAYLSLAIYFRHNGLGEHSLSSIITPRLLERARLLGGLMRVAYLVSASMPNTLPQTSLTKRIRTVTLTLPSSLAMLASEKLQGRVKAFAKLVKLEGEIKTT